MANLRNCSDENVSNKKTASREYSNSFKRYKLFSKALENAYLTTFIGYIMCYYYIADNKFIDVADLAIILLGFVFLLMIIAINSYAIIPEKEKILTARHMQPTKKRFVVRLVTSITDKLLDKK